MRDKCGSGHSGSSGNRGLVYWIPLPSKGRREKRKDSKLSEGEKTNIRSTMTRARQLSLMIR